MTTITLPDQRPYRDMMTFFGPNRVELVITSGLLKQLEELPRSLIDVLADDVQIQGGGDCWFTYTIDAWVKLCGAIADFHSHPLPDALDGFIADAVRLTGGRPTWWKGATP